MELIYEIAETVANLLDGFLGLIFISLVCGRKKEIKLPFLLLGIIVLGIPLSVVSVYVSSIAVQVLICSLVLMGFAIAFLDNGIGKKLYCVFIWNVVLMLSNILVIYGLVYFFKWDSDVATQTGSGQRLLAIMVCKICLIFMCVLFIYYDNRHSMDYKQWLITIIQFVGTLFIGAVIADLYQRNVFDESSARELILISMALLVICVAVCVCQHIINKQNQYMVEYEKLRTHLEVENRNIEKIQELYENSSILRHDIKHYAVMVKELLKNKDYEKIENIMDEMIEEKLTGDTVIYTSNDMLNAVLNSKLSICKKHNIRFDVEVSCKIPDDHIINMCVVMSNILDNAIEAEIKEKDRLIRCTMNRNQDMLSILVGNRISKSVLADNPQLITSKNDKDNHGFGTKSIIKRVKQMDGTYRVVETKDEFLVEIFVPFV